jgi:hypothetical protein
MRVCAAILLVTACTHHHPVATLLPMSTSGEATAQLSDGHDVEVRAAPTAAGARWIAQGETPATPVRAGVTVESADMRSYTTVSRGRGAVEGLALGVLGGAAIGVGIGLASGNDDPTRCFICFSAGDKAILGGFALGSIGLAVGTLLGVMIGSRDVYEVDPAHMPRISTMIAPGRAGAGLSWSF